MLRSQFLYLVSIWFIVLELYQGQNIEKPEINKKKIQFQKWPERSFDRQTDEYAVLLPDVHLPYQPLTINHEMYYFTFTL